MLQSSCLLYFYIFPIMGSCGADTYLYSFSFIYFLGRTVIKYFVKKILFFFVVGGSFYFNQGLNHSVFSSDVLEILTNLSTSILVTCSSHSLLLSTHSLICWIPQDSSYSIYFCFANYFSSTFISFAPNICLVFMFLPLFLVHMS